MAASGKLMENGIPRYFRLRPHVFIVRGASRGALYDLQRNRIFPIPPSAVWVLERCLEAPVTDMLAQIGSASDHDVALKYLEQLESMDFGRYHDHESALLPFDDSPAEHEWRRLLRISIDLRGQPLSAVDRVDWIDVIRAARSARCRQLTVFVTADAEREREETALLEGAAALHFDHIEVVFPADQVSRGWEALATRAGLRIALHGRADPSNRTFLRLQSLRVPVRFSYPDSPPPIDANSLICDHASFRRFRHCSIHCNSLHITGEGQVFPWALERHHRIGHVSNGTSLLDLLAGDDLRRVWKFTKDFVSQCRDCEFRYACPHSYTFRADTAAVGSPPLHCLYDPYTARWQGQSRPAASSHDLSPRRSDVTEYFDVFSDARNPMPARYIPVLDSIIDRAVDQLGLPKPVRRVQYFFDPSARLLPEPVAAHDRMHTHGITTYRFIEAADQAVIRSIYPAHAHTVMHALLHQVNPRPRFFVSEACATMLNVKWAIEEDQIGDGTPFSLDETTDLDQRSVHDIARYVVVQLNAPADLHSWFDSIDEPRSLPAYFHYVGGSFFLWLIQAYGTKRFCQFYSTKQWTRHLEQIYDETIDSLVRQWHNADFMAGT
jgi:radical SAM protein with 4Fe4S-binding SPASM domain